MKRARRRADFARPFRNRNPRPDVLFPASADARSPRSQIHPVFPVACKTSLDADLPAFRTRRSVAAELAPQSRQIDHRGRSMGARATAGSKFENAKSQGLSTSPSFGDFLAGPRRAVRSEFDRSESCQSGPLIAPESLERSFHASEACLKQGIAREERPRGNTVLDTINRNWRIIGTQLGDQARIRRLRTEGSPPSSARTGIRALIGALGAGGLSGAQRRGVRAYPGGSTNSAAASPRSTHSPLTARRSARWTRFAVPTSLTILPRQCRRHADADCNVRNWTMKSPYRKGFEVFQILVSCDTFVFL